MKNIYIQWHESTRKVLIPKTATNSPAKLSSFISRATKGSYRMGTSNLTPKEFKNILESGEALELKYFLHNITISETEERTFLIGSNL